MVKSLLYAKRAFVTVVAAAMLACSVSWSAVYAEDPAVNIACDTDGKTSVTNVGDDTNGLITISFDKEMDESTLTKDNIVLSRSDDSAVDYEITVEDSKTVTIDKMYLSNLSMDNSNIAPGTELAAQNFKIAVKNVKANGSDSAEPEKEFAFSTAEIVAPVPYVKGKLIRDVSAGVDIEARYGFADSSVSAGNGTDRNVGTCIWVKDGADDASNAEKNDWVAKYDLGSEYEICGAALRNFAGYGDYREIVVGGSCDANLDKSTDQGFEQYFKTNANFGDNSNRNKVFNAFFAQGTKTARYIYLVHPRGGTNTTRFSELYVFAYVDGPKNFVASTTPVDGATGVTNIGLNESGYVEINFSEAMDAATLNKDSIVLTNSAGDVIEYVPAVNDGTIYKIDKKYLSSISKSNSGSSVGTALRGDTFTITLNSKAKAANGRAQSEYSFSLTTAELVAPVSYVDGKKIIDVASRLPVETRYGINDSENVRDFGTDGNENTIVRIKDADDVAQNGTPSDKWTFRYDLGKTYDIAGVAIQNGNKFCFRIVSLGGSNSENIENYTDATEYLKTGDYSNDAKTFVYSFFDKNEGNAARYIYGGHGKTNVTEVHIAELKVFAYVDEGEDPFAFTINGNLGANRVTASVDRTKYPNGTVIVALYKDGVLVNTSVTENAAETGMIYVSGALANGADWTSFPTSDGHYQVKAYLWDSIEGMKALADSTTLIRTKR